MEGLDLIALSIPVFFALIGVEVLIARLKGERLYRLNDSLNDLACGILQQVLGVFTKVIVFGTYIGLYEIGHLLEIPKGSWVSWVLCFLAIDFLYYWFHRVSHEVNLPWGAHIVHHSSEEFNLAVALRQGAFQPLFSWIFYLPLAVLGFPPLIFLVNKSLNTLYQFWIHTRMIGKLGPLEWVLNTPSHHRVHHGCDAKYIDRNYAGALIVWDRLFGTFQEEEEEPTYGITKPLQSWNPLWANFHYYTDLVRAGRRAPNLREKLRLWLAAPAEAPDWAREELAATRVRTPLTHGEAGKYDVDAPRGTAAYAVLQFVGALLLTVLLLFLGEAISLAEELALAFLVAWTLVNVGAMFERRSWLVAAELLRLAALGGVSVGAAFRLAPASGGGAAIAATIIASSLVLGFLASWFLRLRKRFRQVAARGEEASAPLPARNPLESI